MVELKNIKVLFFFSKETISPIADTPNMLLNLFANNVATTFKKNVYFYHFTNTYIIIYLFIKLIQFQIGFIKLVKSKKNTDYRPFA